jgi:hypothetical protein
MFPHSQIRGKLVKVRNSGLRPLKSSLIIPFNVASPPPPTLKGKVKWHARNSPDSHRVFISPAHLGQLPYQPVANRKKRWINSGIRLPFLLVSLVLPQVDTAGLFAFISIRWLSNTPFFPSSLLQHSETRKPLSELAVYHARTYEGPLLFGHCCHTIDFCSW